MKYWTLIALLTALVPWGAGCNNEQACAIDDDCFRGEFCVSGTCSSERPTGDGGTGTDGDSSSDAGGGNIGGPDAPNNTGSDAGGNNTNNENNTTDVGDNTTDAGGGDSGTVTSACAADPFDASCRADDNDSFREYIFFDQGAPGCDNNNDFIPQSGGIANAQMCALEEQDLYDLNLVPCDDLPFIVEVTVTPRNAECTHAHYGLDVNVQGNDCDEPGDKIRCDTLPGGVKRVSAIVEPSNSLASARIDVTKLDVEYAHFDYDLDIVVRQ